MATAKPSYYSIHHPEPEPKMAPMREAPKINDRELDQHARFAEVAMHGLLRDATHRAEVRAFFKEEAARKNMSLGEVIAVEACHAADAMTLELRKRR